MKIYLIIFLAIALFTVHEAQADYWYARAGLGVNTVLFSDVNEWQDQGSAGGSFGFGYRYQIKGNWHGEASYTHFSQPFVGQPFGKKDEYEDSLDAFYLTIEYQFRN